MCLFTQSLQSSIPAQAPRSAGAKSVLYMMYQYTSKGF